MFRAKSARARPVALAPSRLRRERSDVSRVTGDPPTKVNDTTQQEISHIIHPYRTIRKSTPIQKTLKAYENIGSAATSAAGWNPRTLVCLLTRSDVANVPVAASAAAASGSVLASRAMKETP